MVTEILYVTLLEGKRGGGGGFASICSLWQKDVTNTVCNFVREGEGGLCQYTLMVAKGCGHRNTVCNFVSRGGRGGGGLCQYTLMVAKGCVHRNAVCNLYIFLTNVQRISLLIGLEIVLSPSVF